MTRQILLTLICSIMLAACQDHSQKPEYQSFAEYPVYEGTDLGLQYSPRSSTFRLWAPSAAEVKLHLYELPVDDGAYKSISMQVAEQGTWIAKVKGDLAGKYYAFQTKVADQWGEAVPDPYATAVGTNGKRAQVVDLAETNPEGWADTKPPTIG